MKQLIFLFLGVAVFIIAVGVYSKTPIPQKNTPDNKPLTKGEVTIGTTKVSVEIADDEAERKKGLGGRESIGQDEGMLFVFPQKTSNLVFWMKEMSFPIDIIWIDENKIVKIDKNVQPEPGVSDNNLKRYYPETEVNFVLEVSAGFSKNRGARVGDSFILP